MDAAKGFWKTYEERIPWVFASLATLIGVAALATRGWHALDWGLITSTVALFWARAAFDRFPVWTLYAVAAAAPIVVNVVDSDRGEEVAMFLVVLVVSMIAAFEPRRLLVTVYTVSIIVVIVVMSTTGVLTNFGWQNWVFGITFSWGFGEIVHRLRQTIHELEKTRALVADQAALHERRRIARDVHDLVGHSLAVVMLHLTGARHLVRRNPIEAEKALSQAEAAGRQSLAEIRRTIGLLHDDAEADVKVSPSPHLGDIDRLVDEFDAAGVEITLVARGLLDHVEASTALAGYRIVQEALTNVSRHSKGARVAVEVDVGEISCDITVRNQGGARPITAAGAGFGLIGMQERARSVGGSVTAGPAPGGWVVEASLPLPGAGSP